MCDCPWGERWTHSESDWERQADGSCTFRLASRTDQVAWWMMDTAEWVDALSVNLHNQRETPTSCKWDPSTITKLRSNCRSGQESGGGPSCFILQWHHRSRRWEDAFRHRPSASGRDKHHLHILTYCTQLANVLPLAFPPTGWNSVLFSSLQAGARWRSKFVQKR